MLVLLVLVLLVLVLVLVLVLLSSPHGKAGSAGNQDGGMASLQKENAFCVGLLGAIHKKMNYILKTFPCCARALLKQSMNEVYIENVDINCGGDGDENGFFA